MLFRRARPRVLLVTAVAVMALLLSGCQYCTAAKQHREDSPTTRPWWCHSSGDGGHAGGHGDHGGGAYDGQTKGMLSWDDCMASSVQFDAALKYVNQWPTAGDAEADGFHQVVPYVAGMGTHHVRVRDFGAHHFDDPEFDPLDPRFKDSIVDDVLDATQPEYLMYDERPWSASRRHGVVRADGGRTTARRRCRWQRLVARPSPAVLRPGHGPVPRPEPHRRGLRFT